MMGGEILLRVKPVMEEHLRRGGYVLVDARFYRNQTGRTILEALVDREEGGITLDECAVLSREIGGLLDAAGLLGAPYTLDVSSPGLDRPLVTPADYRRALGREIRVFLKEPVEGKIEYAGALNAASDDGITLATKQKTLNLSLDKINKAKQVIE